MNTGESLNIPSPISKLDYFQNGNSVFIKHENKIHPLFGGNKWRKLQYNIEALKASGADCILSFGGAFSNHLYALAMLTEHLGIPSVGIVRGEYQDKNNPSLNAIKKAGMKIHHVSKIAYRDKEASNEVKHVLQKYPHAFIIPEGGANAYARLGFRDMMQEISDLESYDFIFVAAGTGSTASGIIEYAKANNKVKVINVLKNASLGRSIDTDLENSVCSWEVIEEYHFGGFAKVTPALREFNHWFFNKYGIPLDPVYNAKAMYALIDMLRHGDLGANNRILYIHTGGLQGIKAYEYRSGVSWQ